MCSVPVVTSQPTVDYSLAITRIEADQMLSENQQLFEFSGNVQIQRESQSIYADKLRFDKSTGQMEASGNATFQDQSLSIKAQSLNLDDENNTSLFYETEFHLLDSHLRGSAKQIQQLDENLRELTDVSYTTCDPGRNTWSLDTGKLSLDQQSGRGTAKHAIFRIKDIPVFYFPWFQFPIDDRRMSGVLAPTLSTSKSHGNEISLPVYWNMAENYDMTITPINYSKRGLQLNTENRYLFKQNLGQLDLSYLQDEVTSTDRWFRRWQHEADFYGIHASILNQKVSDDEFVDDYEHLGPVENVDFLKNSVLFSSTFYDWNSSVLFEEYDTINQARKTSEPYKRLPQALMSRRFELYGERILLDWSNELVAFDKETGITGNRLHINPSFSIPMEGSYYFINPELSLDFTQYDLDNSLTLKPDQQRSLALFSIDSGLFFERMAGSSGNWLHTLEPRLYALYVPYKDQSGIPRFDTSLATENYNSLFTNNRFTGADRIGDSRQISLGITTRFLNSNTGREVFSASIGQAFYSGERKVSLTTSTDTREKSSLMSLLKYQPTPEWDIQLSSVFDQTTSDSKQTDIALRRHDNDSALNLEYHFRENNLEQSTLSFVYPLGFNWHSFAKRSYSLRHDRRPVQNLVGFAYESCCWAFKILYEEDSDDNFTDTDYSVYFQLTFKGLANAGKDIDSLLEDGILGYRPVF